MKKSKKKKTNNTFSKMVSFILLITSIVLLNVVYYFKILPTTYFLLLTLVYAILTIFLIYTNLKNKGAVRVITTLLSFIMIIVNIVLCVASFTAIDFLNNIFDSGKRTTEYGIYVLNDSEYKEIKELKDKKIAVLKDESEEYQEAISKLNKLVKYEKQELTSNEELIKQCTNKKVDAIFIDTTIMEIYISENNLENIRLLGTVNVTTKKEVELKEADVTSESFVVYLSGVDTYGKIYQSSRSDVNLLALVNPTTGKILLLNTPRDYYVTLGTKNALDKLTHAGVYGVEESVKTLEKLYDIEINYYARLNFTSFVKLIDNLNGVTVDVEKPDYRYNLSKDCGVGYICEANSRRESDDKTIYVKYGTRTLNGEEALAYSRNRHQFKEGDSARGRHQQQIVKAIIEKALNSTTVLTNYPTILKDLSKGLMTNVEQNTLTKLINNQLDKKTKWEIESINVTGTDAYRKAYSTGNSNVYVMIPDEESLQTAKDKAKEVLGIVG